MSKSRGIVYLVGAGPGDIGLLTLRGAEVLGSADVVVCDQLVPPDFMRYVPKDAERMVRSRSQEDAGESQRELTDLLIARAREGKCVVRLKGGDPYIFGRGGEEAEALAKAGVLFEVVPGVSSLSAVPAYAGIPITHRDHASIFTVFTGHEDPTQTDSDLDWARVAATPGTKVILMGARRIAAVAESLITHGLPAQTPVAMIRHGTTGKQHVITGTLESIGGIATREGMAPPAVTVIGDVVRFREQLQWFESRPLFGQTVVITRSREQALPLRRLLREAGADVLEIPAIQFAPPSEREPLVEAIAGLNGYDWLVFTSVNGVNAFFEHFFKAYHDLRDLGGAHIAAVGTATAARLQELHLQVDAIPSEFLGARLASAIAEHGSLENLRMLLLRAEVANPEIVRILEEKGAIVDDVSCYRTVADTSDPLGEAARFAQAGADWVTFTSGSTVQHFHERFNLPELTKRFPRLRFASIGPETTKMLETSGARAHAQARPHTVEGLVEAIRKATGKPRSP